MATFATLVMSVVSNMCLLSQGAVLKFDRQAPTDLNNNTCGLINCQHSLGPDDLSVEEISLFDLAGPASLVRVKPDRCEHAKYDDVILVSKSFSKTGAGVEVGVRGAKVCSDGEFMCEVIYVNGQLDKVTDVQIASPNTVTRDELHRQLSNVTSSLQTMQNQLIILTETFNACTANCQTRQEWRLAFRGTAGIGKSVYAAYKDGVGIPANVESGCKQVGRNLPCSNHYRNNTTLDNWKEISEVAFVVYKNNVKVRQVIFDGAGSTYMNWLDKSRVKESSWTDIKNVTTNFFSIEGDQVLNRTFFMNHLYRGCPNDFGWFVAVDRIDPPCPWEKTGPYPVFKYSTSQTNMNYNDPNVTQADYFGALVRFLNLP